MDSSSRSGGESSESLCNYPKTSPRLTSPRLRDSIKGSGESTKNCLSQEATITYTKHKSENPRNDLKVTEQEKGKMVLGKERESRKRRSVVLEQEKGKMVLGKERESGKRKRVVLGKEQEQENGKMVLGKERESGKRKGVVLEKEQENRKSVFEKGRESTKRYEEIKKCRSERSLSLCEICMDKKTKAEIFMSNNCSHFYCHVCISNHVAAKVSQNILKVKCPDLGCNSFLEPQNCGSFIPRTVLDRWEAALCESVIRSKTIYCPFKDCSAPLVDDAKEVVTSAECPHCHRLFCAQCCVPWHAGSKCKSKNSDNMDKKFMELAKTEKWQKCPKCRFYVQRTKGCESITCRL